MTTFRLHQKNVEIFLFHLHWETFLFSSFFSLYYKIFLLVSTVFSLARLHEKAWEKIEGKRRMIAEFMKGKEEEKFFRTIKKLQDYANFSLHSLCLSFSYWTKIIQVLRLLRLADLNNWMLLCIVGDFWEMKMLWNDFCGTLDQLGMVENDVIPVITWNLP